MSEIQRTYTPVDGSLFLERELANDTQIEDVLTHAEAAQAGWRAASIADRAAACTALVDWLVARKDQLGEELTWQMGRPVRYTPNEIAGGFQERARYMIGVAPETLANIQPAPKEGFRRFIRREPVGTVLVLAPWNYPWLTAVNAVIPALMAGNSVILKHSDQTPLVAERLTEAAHAAGMPAGVFQHIHMTHEAVARVIQDPRVDAVVFTGSVAGGHAVTQAASTRFVRVATELGGKDPAYVRADAGLPFAIENVMDGVLFNSGQSCCAVERIYVHQDVYQSFVDGAVALTNSYMLGNPLGSDVTLGPLVRTRAADFVRGQIAEAVAHGAQALIDPVRFPDDRPDSPYLAPQILVNVDHTMRVMSEESFGPVVGIMPVKDDMEAVRLMNDSVYGLTASIWTRDVDAAIALGGQIEAGTVYMNRCDYLDPALVWTGVKDSGRGMSLSVLGYEHFTQAKSYHLRIAT
ncbi:MAG: aldehyde dehydrogenase family protein [Chloroflexi bacterium]|nr:aldehyde dehydrogenase family protein [Chloroflexota bacterium]